MNPGDFTSWSPEGSFTLFEERDWRAENGYTGAPIFEDENDFLIVAPAAEPDRFYFGIVRDGRPWQFVNGPFVARRDNLWERIRSINPAINTEDLYLEFGTHYANQPSIDHFVDVVTAPAYLPASWIKSPADLVNRAEEIQAAIQKLTDEAPFTTHELDVIFHAAQAGHTDAAIVMSDFKRFSRSMNRKRPAGEGKGDGQ
jgi:hypothetical protein